MNAKQKQIDAINELSATLDSSSAELDTLEYTFAPNTDKAYVVVWADGVNAFRTNGREIAMTGARTFVTLDHDEAMRVAAQLTAKSRELRPDGDAVIPMTLADYALVRRGWIKTMREQFAVALKSAQG